MYKYWGLKMIIVNDYLEKLIEACQSAFADRLLYIGLQGSYLRGEAHENSDIDIMIIIDHFSIKDMDKYQAILKSIGPFEKSCGFICGKDEITRWNPLEVCQLIYTTKDIFGTLKDFLPPATREDEINYVKISLGNVYHEICHRYIHADREKNIAKFRMTCKSLFFLIQNLYYLESGKFIITKKELKEQVSKDDRKILELAELHDEFNFDEAMSLLFTWCQKAFIRVEELR